MTIAIAESPVAKSRFRAAVRAAVIVWTVTALVAHSDTGVSFPLWMLLSGSLLVIVIGWLFGFGVAVGMARRRDESALAAVRSWLVVPLPIVFAFVLLYFFVPLKLRVFLSGPSLRHSAEYLSQLPAVRFRERPPWVGLFRIREFSRFDSELRFLTSDCGLVDTCGLVLSYDRPPSRGEDSFEHIYADWWHWHQSW